MYLNIILNFFILLIQIANCLNCKGKRQKKEFKKIFVTKIFPNNRTGYTFCAGYTYCAHCSLKYYYLSVTGDGHNLQRKNPRFLLCIPGQSKHPFEDLHQSAYLVKAHRFIRAKGQRFILCIPWILEMGCKKIRLFRIKLFSSTALGRKLLHKTGMNVNYWT